VRLANRATVPKDLWRTATSALAKVNPAEQVHVLVCRTMTSSPSRGESVSSLAQHDDWRPDGTTRWWALLCLSQISGTHYTRLSICALSYIRTVGVDPERCAFGFVNGRTDIVDVKVEGTSRPAQPPLAYTIPVPDVPTRPEPGPTRRTRSQLGSGHVGAGQVEEQVGRGTPGEADVGF
jgi:hypothetical protein